MSNVPSMCIYYCLGCGFLLVQHKFTKWKRDTEEHRGLSSDQLVEDTDVLTTNTLILTGHFDPGSTQQSRGPASQNLSKLTTKPQISGLATSALQHQ